MQQIALNNPISPVNVEELKSLDIRPGDTVRVHQKIQEGGKSRLQVFEGLVLAVKHGKEAGATFTVRRVVDGVGVERIFPLYSPLIDKIEIVRRAKVRRSKLYYIRDKAVREIKRQMRRMMDVTIATESGAEREVRVAAEEEARKTEEAEKAAQEESKEVESTTTEELSNEPVEELKEDINKRDPEESEVKQAEEKTNEAQEEEK